MDLSALPGLRRLAQRRRFRASGEPIPTKRRRGDALGADDKDNGGQSLTPDAPTDSITRASRVSSEPARLIDLPFDVHERIAANSSLGDRRSLRETCKTFQAVVNLLIREARPSDAADIAWAVRHYPNLQVLFADDCRDLVGAAHVTGLKNLKALQQARFENVEFAALAQILQSPSLISLTTSVSGLAQTTLDGLNARNLQKLSLISCETLRDHHFQMFENMPNLEILELDYAQHISGGGFTHVKVPNKLRTLSLYMCSRITDDGLRSIARFTGLEILNLHGAEEITADGLDALYGMKNLRSLDIGECWNLFLDDLLGEFRKLETLKADFVMNDDAWSSVCALAKLKHLHACDSDTPDNIIAAALSGLFQLRELGLINCEKVAGDSLNAISHLPNLEDINLSGCNNLTVEMLRPFEQLEHLRALDIAECPLISEAEVRELGELLPDCDIHSDVGNETPEPDWSH